MVILNIRCILICLLLTSGQQINLYTYCPDLYGQDGSRVHATLELAVSVVRSVGRSVGNIFKIIRFRVIKGTLGYLRVL